MAVYLDSVQHSASSIDQIGFDCVAFFKIIFPFWTVKSVKGLVMIEYDQRVIIRFLWNERMDANQITARLQAQFDEHAYELRTVRLWIAEVHFGRQDLHDEIRTRRRLLYDLDAKILAILDKSPFESAYSIAERLRVGYATVLEHLHVPISLKSFHLRWVLYLLTDDLRKKRKDYASAILLLLNAAERNDWHHHVTGDGYWFLVSALPRRLWTLSRDNVATKTRLDFQSRQFMFEIIRNPSDFYAIDRLPHDTKMNSAYFMTKILTPVEQTIFPRGKAPPQK
jgi:hypothetical protein